MSNRIIFLLLISLPWLIFTSQMQSSGQWNTEKSSLYSDAGYKIRKYMPKSSEGTFVEVKNNDLGVPMTTSYETLISGSQRSTGYNPPSGFTGKSSIRKNIQTINQPVESFQTKKTVTYTSAPTIETSSSKSTKAVTTQTQIQQLPQPGGYFPIEDISKNEPASTALNIIRSRLPALANSRIIKASYQIVGGFNYQFIFEYEYSQGIRLLYRVLVYRDLQNKFTIDQTQYVDLPKPTAGSFIHLTNKNDAPYIDRIHQILVVKLKGTISADSDLIDFDVSPPYYIFQYKISHNNFIKVQLIYDPIINDVKVISTSRQNIQVTQTKSVQSVPKSVITPFSSSILSSSSPILSTSSPILSTSMPSVSTTTTTTTTRRKSQVEERGGNKQTATQRVFVPIILKRQILQKYQIPLSGISFSNIVQYTQTEDYGFDNAEYATPEIRQLVLTILQAVLPQIQSLDQNFQMITTKYKIQETKLIIFLLSNIRGQKSMQTISIKLPKKDIYKRITSGDSNQAITINKINSVLTKIQTESEKSSDSTANLISRLLKNPNIVVSSKQTRTEVDSSLSTRPETQVIQVTNVAPSIIASNPLVTQTVTTSSSSSSSTQTQPISTAKKPETVVIHQIPLKPKVPRYTISTNDNLIRTSSGVSDPAFVPFLTSSYIDSTDSNVFDRIINYLIEKIKIQGDFSIVLINQMKYGVRIVIEMSDSHRLYQAIVTSDNRSPQLLLWRRISTVTDINPQAFSQYYRIDSDQDLKSLIKQVFKSQQMISKFQRIISAQKRVSYDGVYYRIVVQSISNNQFLITFYYIPDKSYNQILQYQLINNGYDARRQKRLVQIPEDDVSFNAAKEYLFKRYASVLSNTVISFISSYETQQSKYFRIVFSGDNGRYEAILAVGLRNGLVTNVRWEKLDDGYTPIPIQRLINNNQYQSIRTSVREHLKNKFGFQASPSYVEIKNVPGLNLYYKLLFNSPFPFTMYLQERISDHSLYVRGLQRIQVAPASQYYNDRLFAGYSLIKLSQLQYDEVYQAFFSILTSKTQVRSNDEILAAFDLKTPSGIFYKVIYRVNGAMYLAHFSYTFSTKEYKLVSFDPFESTIQSGDYRWKCDSTNSISKLCQRCHDDYILTLGRCYKRVLACNLQFAATCQVCNPGFVKSYGVCESSPQKALPKPKQTVINTQQTIVTAKGCKTIYYQPNDNCLVYKNSLCEKCSYRFVLREGVCKRVQDQCQVYDNAGICLRCYGNHYLSNGYCVALDPLCAAANNEGYCTHCYKNYVNIDGKCYIKSNIQINQNSIPPSDPLCIEWNGSRCEKCQFGCFLSKKTSKCTIKDPYCQEFSVQAEQCTICQRGYSLNAGRKCQRVY